MTIIDQQVELVDKQDFMSFCGDEDHECSCTVDKEKIKAFLKESMEAVLIQIADEAFTNIKDPTTERDYELVLYYLRKVNPNIHVGALHEKGAESK